MYCAPNYTSYGTSLLLEMVVFIMAIYIYSFGEAWYEDHATGCTFGVQFYNCGTRDLPLDPNDHYVDVAQVAMPLAVASALLAVLMTAYVISDNQEDGGGMKQEMTAAFGVDFFRMVNLGVGTAMISTTLATLHGHHIRDIDGDTTSMEHDGHTAIATAAFMGVAFIIAIIQCMASYKPSAGSDPEVDLKHARQTSVVITILAFIGTTLFGIATWDNEWFYDGDAVPPANYGLFEICSPGCRDYDEKSSTVHAAGIIAYIVFALCIIFSFAKLGHALGVDMLATHEAHAVKLFHTLAISVLGWYVFGTIHIEKRHDLETRDLQVKHDKYLWLAASTIFTLLMGGQIMNWKQDAVNDRTSYNRL